MMLPRLTRVALLVLTLLVALTAFAGGAALVAGTFLPDSGLVIVPPVEYLEGSPFDSYLVPGLVLGLVLGGVHLVAFILLLRTRWGALAATVAGYAALIWIFVQMMIIPFSFLQALYFAAGLAELGLVLLRLGVLRPEGRSENLAGPTAGRG